MYINDPIGDMLTRIRNGHMALKTNVSCPNSKKRLAVLEVLKNEGYIRNYLVSTIRSGIENINIELKYVDDSPAIKEISSVSKLGRRKYSSFKEIGTVNNGLGIYIISTSKGVMSDIEAKSKKIGGEVLCKVF